MLYPSDTQTVQAQALGVHGGSGKRRGDFGLMQCHMPMDVKISGSVELSGNPMMTLEGYDGVQ